MKKLRLKALELGAKEVLTRAQLRNILGGSCTLNSDCGVFHYCYMGNCYDSNTPPPVGGSGGSGGSGGTGGCTDGSSLCTCKGIYYGCQTSSACSTLCA